MSRIDLIGITKRYNNTVVIDRFDLTVQSGEFLVVVGRSGAGKTTLLRLVAGLEKQEAGSICIDGNDHSGSSARAQKVALVTQDAALYPQLSVTKNLLLRLRDLPASDAQQRVSELIADFGLAGLESRLPSQLSGGEAQRVAVAKAIARGSQQILLLDEPFNQLDAVQKEPLIELLQENVRRAGITTLMVSHDPLDAMRLADRIAVMDRGKLLQCDSPSILYHRPVCRLAGDLMSPVPMNWIAAEDIPAGTWKQPNSKGGYWGFRPEMASVDELDWLADSEDELKLQVSFSRVQDLGFAKLLVGRLPTGQTQPTSIRVMVPSSSACPSLPTTLHVRVSAERLCWVSDDPSSVSLD